MPSNPARIQPPRFDTPVLANPRKALPMTVTDPHGAQPPARIKLSDARPGLDGMLRPHIVNARSALMNALSVTREELDRDSGQRDIGQALTFMTQEIAILSGRLHEIASTSNHNTP